MNILRRYALVVLAVLGAFVGGAAVQWATRATGLSAAEPATRPATQPAAPEVRVRQLVMVDDAGRQRAALLVSPDGPQLVFRDEEGHQRILFGQTARKPDKWSDDKSQWCLSIMDGEGNQRVLAHAYHEGGGSGLKVGDHNNQTRFSVGFIKDGSGGFALFDPQGRERFGIGMPADAGFSIFFKDDGGADLWRRPQRE